MSDRVRGARAGKLAASVVRLGLVVGLATGVVVTAPRVHAQTQDELKAARELFQEAYKDEQEKRYEAALDKFQRVAKVRESASVRYRIASVLESLNRLREARDAFRALADSKPSLAANEQEIATSAEERANALEKRIPTLTLTMDGTPPQDLKVTIDGEPVPQEKLSGPQSLDPGEHTVSASGTGMTPFESKVRLSEGGAVSMTVPVGGAKNGGVGGGGGGGDNGGGSGNKTLGIIGLAAGGALVVTSAVLLAVREGDISDLNAACPNGACPASRQAELESTRDEAKLFGPLGITLGVLGVGAAGFGAYMLLRGESSATPPAPAPSTGSARIKLRVLPGTLPGGAGAFASGTF